MKIAFFGVGHMGGPMARNLIKAGHQVNVYDINPDAVEELVLNGGKGCHTIKETLEGVKVVFSMVTAGKIVRELYLGNQGIFEYAPKGSLLIDCSTIDAESSKLVAKQALKQGFEMLDAPVSGGVAGAEAGTLTFIVGGPKESLERGRELLEKMGKNIFHAGPHGTGQIAKICNNLLLAITMIGTSEALSLGMANGLDPKVLTGIMKKSSGNNWALEKYNPFQGVMDNVPAAKDYQGGFSGNLMTKDLSLALESALKSHSSTPLGTLAWNLYQMHLPNFGHLDFSSIIKSLGGSA